MKKNVWVLVLSLLTAQKTFVAQPTTLQGVLQEYEGALSELLSGGLLASSNAAGKLDEGSAAFSVYKKIIAPYITYINGYGGLIQNKMAHNVSYQNDLKILSQQFAQYEAEVVRLSKYFPANQQEQVVQYFYQQFSDSVVQICFNIVQHSADAMILEQSALTACLDACLLGLKTYKKGMVIQGVSKGTDAPGQLVSSTVKLYNAAIIKIKNAMNFGTASFTSIESSYKQLQVYYAALAQVYSASGSTRQATAMQQQVTDQQQELQLYQMISEQLDAAQAQLKNSRELIQLDLTQATKVAQQLTANYQALLKAYQSFSTAQAGFVSAKNNAGKTKCADQLKLLNNLDLVIRSIQQLWVVYLQDQSSNRVATAPTISQFLHSTKKHKKSVNSLKFALQNAADLITQTSNSVNKLAPQNVQAYSVNGLLQLLSTNAQTISPELISQDDLVSLAGIQAAVQAAKYTALLLQAMADCLTASKTTASLATAMTYAKIMDGLYPASQKLALASYIPYFPDLLQAGATWQLFAATLLQKAKVTATVQTAMAQVGQATVQQPPLAWTPAQITSATKQAQSYLSQAQGLLNKLQFGAAVPLYEKAYSAYQDLYLHQSSTPQAASLYQNMMTTHTLVSASSFASSVKTSGRFSWGRINNIANTFVDPEYQFGAINMATFGAKALPASLATIPVGTPVTSLTPAQQSDLFALIKANIVSQLLEQHGISFTDCFVDYMLTLLPNINAVAQPYVQPALTSAGASVDDFTGASIGSVTIKDNTTISSIICKNLVLAPVTPLYSSMTTAALFLESAYQLFVPGSQSFELGGVTYTPGNDSASANIMLQTLVYACMTEAYGHFQAAQQKMQAIQKSIQATRNTSYPTGFASDLSSINQDMTRAQALLYAQGQSAFAYASQMTTGSPAADIKTLFLSIYQMLVTWLQDCLIGDPSSANYQNVLYQLNETYANWAAMLDPTTAATQVASFNATMAQFFLNAGNKCIATPNIDPMFPFMGQYPYRQAAKYFLSALSKYQLIKNTKQIASTQSLLQETYYKNALQDVQVYLQAKNQGVVYVSDTGQSVTISFAQLQHDDLNGMSDSGEQAAYNAVKGLLLQAGMLFEMLSSQISPKAASQAASEQASTNAQGAVLAYLKAQKMLPATATEIAYSSETVISWMFTSGTQAFNYFQSNEENLAVWMNTLMMAAGKLYAQDYLGATGTATAAQQSQQIQAYMQAMQTEATSMQNPASSYV